MFHCLSKTPFSAASSMRKNCLFCILGTSRCVVTGSCRPQLHRSDHLLGSGLQYPEVPQHVYYYYGFFQPLPTPQWTDCLLATLFSYQTFLLQRHLEHTLVDYLLGLNQRDELRELVLSARGTDMLISLPSLAVFFYSIRHF